MKFYLVGGIFLFLLSISFYLTIIERSDTKKLFPYKMKLYMPRVDGIKEGEQVLLRGTQFGEISQIQKIRYFEIPNPKFLPEPTGDAVEITVSVKSPITIWDNYSIKLKTKTLFSGRHIDLDPGYHEADRGFMKPVYKEPDSPPDHAPSGDYYEDFFSSANTLIQENKPDIRKVVINLRETSSKLNGNKGTLPKLINDDALYKQADLTFSDLSITAKEARWYIENQREIDTIPIPFTMVVVFNLLGLNILSR